MIRRHRILRRHLQPHSQDRRRDRRYHELYEQDPGEFRLRVRHDELDGLRRSVLSSEIPRPTRRKQR